MRLLKGAETIFEDLDIPAGKRDASVQAVLCMCGSSNTNLSISTTRDACEQTTLCGCSELVPVSDACNSISLDSAIEASLDTTSPSHLLPPVHSCVPETAASDKAAEAVVNRKDMVTTEDIDAICKQFAGYDFEDTVIYDYEYENVHPVSGCGSGADCTNVPKVDKGEVVHTSMNIYLDDSRKSVRDASPGVSVIDKFTNNMVESVTATATACEPDASSNDCSYVIMHNLSVQTSAVENATENTVGGLLDSDPANDPLPLSDETESSKLLVASAPCLLPQQPSDDGSALGHSSASPLSDSHTKKNSCSVSLDTSDDDVPELECATDVVHVSDANSSDSALNKCSLSLPTSAVEKAIAVSAVCKPDAVTVNGPLASFDETVELSKTVSTVCSLPPQPVDAGTEMKRYSSNLFSDSYKKSSCGALLDASDNTELMDDVFEPGPVIAAACSHAKAGCTVPAPALEMEADLPLDDSVEKIICQIPEDDETGAARDILTSTALGSPEAIDDFFGLAGSSLSGSSGGPSSRLSVDSGRRKSKPGTRRVSMCGEYEDESFTEFFTPHRSTVCIEGQLTVIADTDEEDDSMSHKSILYTTADNGHLLDAVSESDEDCMCDSVEPAAEGCIPDSPMATSGPVPDQLSEPYPSSDSIEHIYPEPPEDGKSIRSQSESSKVAQHSPSGPGLDGQSASSHGEGIEHLQSKSVMSASSKRNNESQWEARIPMDEDDYKIRYHIFQCFYHELI